MDFLVDFRALFKLNVKILGLIPLQVQIFGFRG